MAYQYFNDDNPEDEEGLTQEELEGKDIEDKKSRRKKPRLNILERDLAFRKEISKVKGALEKWDSMSPQEKKLFKTEYNFIKKHLQKAKERVFDKVKKATRLSFIQNIALKKAKSREFRPFFKGQIRIIQKKLRANIVEKISSKGMSSSPILMYALFGVLIIFMIIAIIAFIGSIMPWLFPDEDNPEGGAVNSVFGVTGADFYGVRMVYSDEVKSKYKMVEDYIKFVDEGANTFTNTATITIESETYTLTLNLNHLALPDEDYDYSQFDEASFVSDYSKLHEIIFKIAKANYNVDNDEEYSGSFLEECVDGIKYFGYSNLPVIAMVVAEDIVTPESFSAVNGDGEAVSGEVKEQIEDEIEMLLLENYLSKYSSVRTEKLFVKDYILDEEDARVSGITKENYVALIFMPKKDVDFKNISFAVGNADLTNFNIEMDGIEVYKADDNLGSEESQTYLYGTGNINLQASEFQDIDVNNLNALSNGVSLLDIVQTVDDPMVYLEQITDENSVEICRLKRNGVVVYLSNTEAFSIVEWETRWE